LSLIRVEVHIEPVSPLYRSFGRNGKQKQSKDGKRWRMKSKIHLWMNRPWMSQSILQYRISLGLLPLPNLLLRKKLYRPLEVSGEGIR